MPENTDSLIATALRRYLAIKIQVSANARTFFRISGFREAVYQELLGALAQQTWRLAEKDLLVCSIDPIPGFPEQALAPHRSATWYRNTVQDGQALILIQNRRSTDAQSLKDLFSVTEMTISQDGIHALLDTCMSRYQLNTEANQRDEIIHFVRRFAKVIHEPQLRDLVEFLVEVDRSMAEQPGMDVRHALAAALPWLGLFRCKELATLKSTHSDKLLRQVWNAARIGDEVLEEPQYSNYIKRLEQVTFDDLNGVSAAQKRRLLASFIAGELRNDRDAQLEVLKIDWNEVKQIVLNKTRNTAQQKIATLATQIQALAEEGTLGGDDVQEVLDDLRNSTEPDPETLDRLLIEQGDALPKRLKTDLQRLVKPRTQRHADFLVGVVSVALTLLVPNQNDLAVGTKLQVQVNLPKGKKDSHLTEACATFRTLYGGIEQEWDQLEWNLKALWDQSEQDPSGEEEAAQNEAEQEREIREEIPFRLILLGPDGKERSRAELIWIYRADSPAGATHQTLLAERKQIGVTEPLRLRVPIFNTCPESSVIDDLDISRPIRSFGAWFEQANSLADLLERSLHKRAQPATWQVVSEALRNLEHAWAAFVQSSQAGLLAARVEPLLNAYEHLLDRVISTFQSGNEISYGYRVLNQAWMISHPDEPNWALMPLFHPLKLLWWRERSRYFSQILDRLLDPATPASIVDESRFRRELRATYGSSGFPPLIALPFKEGKPAEYFVAAEESDGYELFFREAQRAESFGMDSEELADDEQEIAAQHAVEGIAAVIQDYIETYPFVRDGLEIVLFECRNGALPGLLIERLHQISKRRDWQLRITMVVHTSDRGAPIFRRVSEWVERERLPSSREARTYFPAITLQVMQETSHTALFQRCADSDLIILADVLAERGQRMSAKIDLDPATDSKQYLLTYRAQQEPFQAGELQRSMLLTPPQQPRISRLFMLSQYAAIERRKVQPHQQARFYREMSLEAWQPEISTMHDHFNWVVCYDPTIDRFLIESTFPDQVQIIRYSLGLGAKRQHNLTVSSSHKAQDIVIRRLAARLGQMLERHDSSDLLQHVAQRLVEKAKLISGDIVLRAAGPGMFLNELIGLVSAKFATEERYRAQHPDTLSAWILLDDVEHWFSGKFPDLLFVAITTTENGQLKLHLEVIEAKCIGEQAFEAEARDAQRQVLSGIRRISSAFASGAQHLDALNWYDQLYRAVVGNLQVGIDHEEVWNLFREHLHRGDFELDLSGHTWIFCYDGQAGISNGPSEDPFGKGESDLDLRAHHYGRNELFALLRRLIEQHEGPSPDPEVWTPRQEASFPPPNLPPLGGGTELPPGGGTELPPPAGAGGGDEVSVPPPNLPPLGGGTELPPGGGTELPPPAGAGGGDEASLPPPNLPPLGGGTELPPGGGTELPPPAGAGGGGGDEALVPNETEWVANKARNLERVLRRRGIQIMPINPADADVGPSIVRFKFRLAGNESLKKVQTMAEDLARDLALPGTPIIDNISCSTFVGIDIPRERSETIPLRPLLAALGQPGPAELPIILGKTPDGTLICEDLADFPHLLVAGATGSGKSVFLRGLLLSLLTQYRPGNLELLIVDPKRTDFTFFNRLPYLRGGKVIVDGNEARTALLELARSEMQRRQDLIANRSMRMKEFNQRYPDEAQPPIVALIDEYALLTNMMDKKERESFEQDLMILAAASRAVSIHLIIATQHPSAEIVTSKLKANLDARIAFKVATNTNSRVVLDTPGAENLLGNGDMLFRRKSGEIVRIQAPFMDEMTMMEYLKQIG